MVPEFPSSNQTSYADFPSEPTSEARKSASAPVFPRASQIWYAERPSAPVSPCGPGLPLAAKKAYGTDFSGVTPNSIYAVPPEGSTSTFIRIFPLDHGTVANSPDSAVPPPTVNETTPCGDVVVE